MLETATPEFLVTHSPPRKAEAKNAKLCFQRNYEHWDTENLSQTHLFHLCQSVSLFPSNPFLCCSSDRIKPNPVWRHQRSHSISQAKDSVRKTLRFVFFSLFSPFFWRESTVGDFSMSCLGSPPLTTDWRGRAKHHYFKCNWAIRVSGEHSPGKFPVFLGSRVFSASLLGSFRWRRAFRGEEPTD